MGKAKEGTVAGHSSQGRNVLHLLCLVIRRLFVRLFEIAFNDAAAAGGFTRCAMFFLCFGFLTLLQMVGQQCGHSLAREPPKADCKPSWE